MAWKFFERTSRSRLPVPSPERISQPVNTRASAKDLFELACQLAIKNGTTVIITRDGDGAEVKEQGFEEVKD